MANSRDEDRRILDDEASEEEEEEGSDGSAGEKDHIEGLDTDLDADTFGMALCALTRDTHFLAEEWNSSQGHRISMPRLGRLCTTIFLLFFTIGLQCLLLFNTKKYVSAKGVHDIRIAYSVFEESIYACNENSSLSGLGQPVFNATKAVFNATKCEKTKYGSYRGRPGMLPDLETQKIRLASMSEDDQGDACRIPMSQPNFFYLILLIWTLTCFQELRKSCSLTMEIFYLPTINSMMDALEKNDDKETDGDHVSGEVVIVGITCYIKIFMTTLLFARVVITSLLLFLGCRWLLSTNRFSDLILNAIALEFILQLKELIHATLVPIRNSVELGLTKIKNPNKKMRPGCMEFMGTASILLLAIVWCYLYMYYLQEVLPDYRWDVHEVCEGWIARRFNVSTR